MGKIKHLTKVRELFKKSPVVNISSLKKILGKKENYVYLLLNNMIKKGEIFRITRGKYSRFEDPSLAVYCFKPAYLGLQDAFSIHGLWEQETNTIILTTKTVREGIREMMGSNVLLRRLPRELFFGVEYKQYGDFYVPVSDIEKTFLDLVHFSQPLDKKETANLRKIIDVKKLQKYLHNYDKETKEEVKKLLKL